MRSLYLLNRRFGPLARLSEAEIRLSRREALGAALASAAGLLASACASAPAGASRRSGTWFPAAPSRAAARRLATRGGRAG